MLAKKILNLFDKDIKKKLYKLLILIIINTIFEPLIFILLISFIFLITNLSSYSENVFISYFLNIFEISDLNKTIIFYGSFVLMVFAFGSIFSMFTNWKKISFIQEGSYKFTQRLYNYYLNQNWLFHSYNSPAILTKKISKDCTRFFGSVVKSFLEIISNSILVIFLIISMAFFNFKMTFALFTCLSFLYLIIFFINKKKLSFIGKSISETDENIYKIIFNSLKGIRSIIINNTHKFFSKKFIENSKKFFDYHIKIKMYEILPKQLIIFISFSFMIFLSIFISINYENNIKDFLPLLAGYSYALFKLIPSFQSIYANLASIRGNIYSLKNIYKEIVMSKYQENFFLPDNIESFDFEKSIEFKKVHYSYPRTNKIIFEDINLFIKKGEIISLVGDTGSGKSTFLDLLTGLIEANKGNIFIDDNILKKENIRKWQKKISYVSQDGFIVEGTLKHNIIFGSNNINIDAKKIDQIIKICQLQEFVSKLPNGINTKLSDDGKNISGGQKQRISIARALYFESDIIILDEASNSLDKTTEKKLFEDLIKLNKTFIIISHDRNLLKYSDKKYEIKNNKINEI